MQVRSNKLYMLIIIFEYIFRMCRTCRQHCRIVKFDFQCAKFYHDYAKSTAYSKPDLSMNSLIKLTTSDCRIFFAT